MFFARERFDPWGIVMYSFQEVIIEWEQKKREEESLGMARVSDERRSMSQKG